MRKIKILANISENCPNYDFIKNNLKVFLNELYLITKTNFNFFKIKLHK